MEQNINDEVQNAFERSKKKEPVRRFAGKTEFVLDYSTPETLAASKAERHFYQRMLRAYLRGKEVFNFGFRNGIGRDKIPIEHRVLFTFE